MVVVFRIDPGGEVFALFPEVKSEVPGFITCYERDGRKIPADYDYCIAMSRPARVSEYRPLLNDMQALGHTDLRVRRRLPRKPLTQGGQSC